MHAADRAAAIAARGRSADTVRRWRAGVEHRALAGWFEGCPLDRPEPAAERAERLLAEPGWAASLLTPLVEALAADPFFEPPLRFTRDAGSSSMVLFDCPAVSLVLSTTQARPPRPGPETIVFSGFVTVTRFEQAAGATLHRWSAEPIGPDFTAAGAGPCTALAPLSLADGVVMRCDGRRRAHWVEPGGADMFTLIASIRAGAEPLMREYRTTDGALVRLASADEGASRTEMLLALLRHMGRADAGDCFATASRDAAFHTRWAAMREWLALDARAALPRLAEMAAGDPHADVRIAAGRTLAIVEAACRA